ncbi:MAG: hypothetical protein U9Q69_05795 [Nanoarchaeota archaeon]|nr:hypothetical protein [Nanoarchaeota archaeon]
MKCPKCGSKNIKVEKIMGKDCIACLDCGYDDLSIVAESQSSRKGKNKYSPYKKGGPKRTLK